jgi:hypothetical protein
VLLLFSASHLANVGLAQYTVDLLDAIQKLKGSVGRDTSCLPLPPIILGGTENEDLVRSTFELIAWSADFFGNTDGIVVECGAHTRELMLELSDSAMSPVGYRRMSLPAYPNGKRVWESGGDSSEAMPRSQKPLTQSQEVRMVANIISEVRAKCGLNLDPAPSHDRGLGPQSKPTRKGDLLLVGSSNASKMSAMLTEKGKSMALLFSPGWTISRFNVEQMAANINRKLAEVDPAVVILQLLDNTSVVDPNPNPNPK